ncbi:MFS transporter [Salinicola acroporae]|uniref:MFS transporter n=1 Tax=Salinicola acroporae TaxID=1541440 RepID=A0ABT6I513_9GAMM|nr:MFS transporter [Salinicola acroporae]MDH4572731.1 MFS transporter [Salinicola acroporae]
MRSPNRHFFVSLLLSRLADQMLLFLVPLVIYQLTGSVAWSGLAFFFETLPRFLAFPLCGQLCDRHRNDRLLRSSQRWRMATCMAAILGYLAIPHVAWLIGLSALVGILSTQGVMAREMLLVQAFGSARYERLVSHAQLFDQVGTVLGPLVAAALLARLEWEAVVVVIALGFAVSDLAVWRWQRLARPELPVPRPHAANGYRALLIAGHHLRVSPALPASIGLAMAVNLLLGTLLATAPAVVTGVQSHGEIYYGVLQAGGALATVLVLLFTARSLIPADRLGLLAYAAMALGGLMASVTAISSLYALGFLLVIGFDKMFSVSIRSLRRRVIPSEDFGKTTGLVVMLNNLTQPLGGLIVSTTAGFLATGSILLAVALVMVFAGGIILWRYRDHVLPSLSGR